MVHNSFREIPKMLSRLKIASTSSRATFLLLLFTFLLFSVRGTNIEDGSCVVGENSNDNGTCQQERETVEIKDRDEAVPSTTTSCQDENDYCVHWADDGECENNPGYMHVNCRLSCKLCNVEEEDTRTFAQSFGVDQDLECTLHGVTKETAQARLLKTKKYMNSLTKDVFNQELKSMCQNKHQMCTIWAVYGECDNNPNFMKMNCAPACQSCDFLSADTRCPLDPNAPEAWGPNDLDKMFTRLVNEPYLSQYQVEILSSPSTSGGPWIITMENFVSEEEANRIIELGESLGYQESKQHGKILPDGTIEHHVNTQRTSKNAWCVDHCQTDEVANTILERITNMTGIPEPNSEQFQLLKYQPGEYYRAHHDYLPHEKQRPRGCRILTVYMYLNDVEQGGGTKFDKLGLTVMPKRGRLLLWPSVLNDRPHDKDPRTSHEALPVEAGVKYGANAWFHMRDFRTPFGKGCP